MRRYLIGYSSSPVGLRVSSISSSAFKDASSNDIFGRFLNSLTLFGCELSLAPMIVSPLSLILPVNGILNRSCAVNKKSNFFFHLIFRKSYNWNTIHKLSIILTSSSASLSTNCSINKKLQYFN